MSDCRASAGLVPVPSVEDRVRVLIFVSTPVLRDFGVVVILDRARTFRGLQVIAAGFGVIDLGLAVDCRCAVVPDPGSRSKCAGLLRSSVTMSALPFMTIFITRPLLEMTL